MATTYLTNNSSGQTVGDMICHKCGDHIGDNTDFLIEERYSIHDRGNETDECYVYHRNCTSLVKEWQEHDKRVNEIAKFKKQREEKRQQILTLIEEWNFDEDELF